MLMCMTTGLGMGLYSCFYRYKLRKAYELAEKPCADCCVHLFCDPCALCQEYRELHNRGFVMDIGACVRAFVIYRWSVFPSCRPAVRVLNCGGWMQGGTPTWSCSSAAAWRRPCRPPCT